MLRRIRNNVSKMWICKLLIIFNVLTFPGLLLYNRVSTENYYSVIRSDDVLQLNNKLRSHRCNFPKLQPFDPQVLPHLEKVSPVNCAHGSSTGAGGEIIFIQEKGTRIIKQVKTIEGEGKNCCYRPFTRVDDDEEEIGSTCIPITEKRTEIPLEHEYIEILCVQGRVDYRDGFAFVSKKPNVEQWAVKVDHATGRVNFTERLSVMILGLDATSHMNFLRTMPLSNEYLLQNLSAVVLNGYTKVAENTLPNVVPLLTGLSMNEFKTNYVDKNKPPGEIHLDSCPFVWKRFSANGYRTSFAEDDVNIGIFNMDWAHAFRKPPTDYYLRPFSSGMQRRQNHADGLCYGSRLSFQVLLDNLANTAAAFDKSEPYFQFTWATKLSHDNFNKMALGDVPLLKFLRYMKRSGHLNHTALIVMSDHGSRIDAMRATPQGKVEDRMPLFYIVLPPWFQQKYPKAHSNLLLNSNHLTSAFDVHKTFEDFMDLNRLEDMENLEIESINLEPSATILRPMSLFERISENRSCFEAGVPLHWCVCHEHEGSHLKTNFESEEVKSAVAFSIDAMNFKLRRQSSCAELTLKRITDAFHLDFDVDVVTNEGTPQGLVLLRVAFVVAPSDGEFEATVLREKDGQWVLTEQVVRTNKYGDQSQCVSQEFKEFCYCIE